MIKEIYTNIALGIDKQEYDAKLVWNWLNGNLSPDWVGILERLEEEGEIDETDDDFNGEGELQCDDNE